MPSKAESSKRQLWGSRHGRSTLGRLHDILFHFTGRHGLRWPPMRDLLHVFWDLALKILWPAKPKALPVNLSTGIKARDQVLGDVYLLENIFVHLDQVELFTRLQRVNRRFKAAVEQSPVLQKAMDFRPDDSMPPGRYRLSWFIGRIPFRMPYWWAMHERPFAQGFTRMHYYSQAVPHGPLSFPDASWRRMVVMHPAPRLVTVFRRAARGVPAESQTIAYPEGIRFGDLADLAMRFGSDEFECLWVCGERISVEEATEAYAIAQKAGSTLLLYWD